MRSLHRPVTVVMLAAFLAVSACGPPEPADGANSGGTVEAIGAGPSGDPSPSSPVSEPEPTAVTQPATEPEPEPDYPATARAYAEAVVAAWKQDQIDVLGDLATAGVQEQIIEIPGPLNMEWSFRMCDGTAGSSYCWFDNAIGDVLILRISHSLLGQAHAAIEVRLDAKA